MLEVKTTLYKIKTSMFRIAKNPFFKKGRCITALLIIVALLLTVSSSVPTEAASLKEEAVYVRLKNDGTVDRVYVVNSFQLGKNREITDYGNYEYVQNLTDNGVVELNNGVVTLNAKGDRVYYEGYLANPQLPWNISIKYVLDGREILPEDLPGQSGHLAIQINTGPNPRGNKEFFDTFALQVALTLKGSICKNITAEGGTISIAGENKQINYVALPGKKAFLEVSADVENFEMPAITIAGVRLKMDFDFDMEDIDTSELGKLTDAVIELDDGVQELLDGIFNMRDGVSELHGGTVELRDGTGEFRDGIGELVEGVGELKDGVSELKDGTSEMADGALQLSDGAVELVDGVRELNDGVESFAGGIDELYDGIGELHEGMLALYSGMSEIIDGSGELEAGAYQLGSGIREAAEAGGVLTAGFSQFFDGLMALVNAQLDGSGLPVLTRDNYAAVIENAVFGQAIFLARQTIKNEVYTVAENSILEAVLPNFGMTREQFDALPQDNDTRILIMQVVQGQLTAMETELDAQVEAILAQNMEEILDKAGKDPQAQQLLSLLDMIKGYEQLLNGLEEYAAGIKQLNSGTWSLYEGISELNDGLEEYRNGMAEFAGGIEEFYGKSHELVDGAYKLRDGTFELLDGVIQLKDGIIEFKDGAIQLHDGVIQLFDGIVELHDGVIELYDGAIELHDGVVRLADGTGELKKGVNDLYNGVASLKDGTGEFREKTSTLELDITGTIKDKIREMLGDDAPVKSFVSEKNGEVAAVQFIMQTEGISKPQVEAREIQPAPKLSLWQRFARLFGFLR